MSEIVEKRISEICDVAASDKSITCANAREREGTYPVYAATMGEPLTYINFYNNDRSCLAVVNDGVKAGYTYIIEDEKYTIGKHITGLIPHDGIDIEYLQLVSEPIFRQIAKGYGLGNLPKLDVLNAVITLPITDDGTYDLDEQRRLAGIYSEIEEQRQKLLDRIFEIQELLIHINKDEGVEYADVPLNEIVTHNNGNAIYTKTWCQGHRGSYPLYSANNFEPIAYVDIFDYEGEYLTYSKNGCAGYITIFSGRFSVNGDRCVMTINEEFVGKVNLLYLKYYLEPIFRQHKKGRLGIYGKNEFTKLNSTMIRELDIKVPIPLADDGSYDLEKQIEIAERYRQIDDIKAGLISKITQLTSICVTPEAV
jgi:type I restriction enzyme S subunit